MAKIREETLCLTVPEDSVEEGMYDGYYNCPVCDEDFIDNNWKSSVAGGPWGGTAVWTCPSCKNNSIVVNY